MPKVNQVVTLKASEIVNPPKMLRVASTEDADVHELGQKLSSVGQLEPVVVYYDSNNKIYLSGNGNRRCTAAQWLEQNGESVKDLNPGEILAIVKGIDVTPEQILLEQISANEENKTTTGKQYGQAIHTLVSESNLSVEKISDELGVSKASIYKWIKALNLGEDILDKIKEGTISLNVAEKAAKKFKRLTPEQQSEVMDKAEKLPASDFSEWHEDFLKNVTPAKKKAEFTRKMKPMTKQEMVLELENAEADFAEDASGVNEGRVLALRTILHCTEEEVAEQRAEWEAKAKKKDSKSPEALRAKAEKLMAEAAAAETKSN